MLLANYSLHYVDGAGQGRLSADSFGISCERMAELLAAETQDSALVALRRTSPEATNTIPQFTEAFLNLLEKPK